MYGGFGSFPLFPSLGIWLYYTDIINYFCVSCLMSVTFRELALLPSSGTQIVLNPKRLVYDIHSETGQCAALAYNVGQFTCNVLALSGS